MQNITKYLIVAGLIGVITFIVLRPYVDMNANGAIQKDAASVESEISIVAEQLGFSMDTLGMATLYQQHGGYLQDLRDSVNADLRPSDMNDRNGHIQSWVSVIGQKGGMNGMIITADGAFNTFGQVRFRTSNQGKIIRFEESEIRSNPTFVQGESAEIVAQKVVSDFLNYPLENYTPNKVEQAIDSEFVTQSIETSDSTYNLIEAPEYSVTWTKLASAEGPEYLSLSLRQKTQEVEENGEIVTRFGYELTNFSAKYEIEPDNLGSVEQNQFNLFAYFFIGSLIVLAILVITVGMRNIFLGKVEWRRALIILFLLMLGYLGWRSIFYLSVYADFIDTTAAIQINLNNLLTSLLVGFYGAMAYISWEAFARSQRNGQLELVDTIWQKRFFVRENGLALINGFAIGGVLLGAFSIMVFLQDSFFVQSDSQFGTAEAAINAKLLTINMSAWSTTWLIGFAQVGFVYGFCKHWIKQEWGVLVFAIFFSSIFLTVLGRLVGTPGEFFDDFILYLVLGAIIVISYQQFGIITSNTAWWFFVSVILVLPYLNSPSTNLALVSWIQGGIHLAIIFFAFVAYKYGISVSEVGNYIPEYQARLAQQMRVEKEIEIARDSQYQLMPINPPKAEGLDVYGFFLPSFEVGGDYFDYVLSKDEEGKATALTMTVVDVSGKAMRAAMPAVFTSGLLLAKMKTDLPDVILSDVAEPIFNRTDKRTFITCAIARFDMVENHMIVANAGHCKPILKRNGVADFIQTPDPKLPLGFKPDIEYGAHSFKVKKGDVFLLYSDGLPEAENEQGERFGFDEVPRLLEEIDTEILTAQEIAQEIKRTVQTYSNFKLADDTTVICLKV